MENPSCNQWNRGRKIFLGAIITYLLFWVTGFIFLWQEFGVESPLFLTIVTLIPLYVMLRTYYKVSPLKKRDFISNFLALILIFSVIGFSVHEFYNQGYADWHDKCVKYAAFERLLHDEYPEFKNVYLNRHHKYGSKRILILDGTVATQADIERLKVLMEEQEVDYGIIAITVGSDAEPFTTDEN